MPQPHPASMVSTFVQKLWHRSPSGRCIIASRPSSPSHDSSCLALPTPDASRRHPQRTHARNTASPPAASSPRAPASPSAVGCAPAALSRNLSSPSNPRSRRPPPTIFSGLLSLHGGAASSSLPSRSARGSWERTPLDSPPAHPSPFHTPLSLVKWPPAGFNADEGDVRLYLANTYSRGLRRTQVSFYISVACSRYSAQVCHTRS